MVGKKDENDDWPIIFSYTRKQAMEDGVLIDVSDEAKSAGFKVPAASATTCSGAQAEGDVGARNDQGEWGGAGEPKRLTKRLTTKKQGLGFYA